MNNYGGSNLFFRHHSLSFGYYTIRFPTYNGKNSILARYKD